MNNFNGENPADKNSYLIEGRSIVKSYPAPGGKLVVLRGADIAVKRGEMIAVMGASGSGKSTLLHVLGALDKIDSGVVILDGNDIARLGESRRAEIRNNRIGFVFQFYHLFSDFNVLENVLMPARISRELSGKRKKLFKEKAKELLDRVGLGGRLKHRPFELSGGEQQRVAIARALFNDPDVILADEPTGNLDPETGRSIHKLLRTLNEETGKAIIIATHNPGLAEVCDRVSYLVEGRITEVPPAGF